MECSLEKVLPAPCGGSSGHGPTRQDIRMPVMQGRAIHFESGKLEHSYLLCVGRWHSLPPESMKQPQATCIRVVFFQTGPWLLLFQLIFLY